MNGAHVVFGKCTDGLNVLDAIEANPVDRNDKPKKPVDISSVERG